MGAAPAGEPGEAWGYRAAAAGGRGRSGSARAQLEFGPAADPSRPSRSLPSSATPTPTAGRSSTPRVDERRQPYRGPVPNRLSARITTRAAASWSAATLDRPAGEQVVVLAPRPGRLLAGARRRRRRRAAAGRRRSARRRRWPANRASARWRSRPSTRPARPGCCSGRRGARSPTAIVHWDGSEWRTRAGRSAGRLRRHLPDPRDRRDRARQRLGARRGRRPDAEPLAGPARAHLDARKARSGSSGRWPEPRSPSANARRRRSPARPRSAARRSR